MLIVPSLLTRTPGDGEVGTVSRRTANSPLWAWRRRCYVHRVSTCPDSSRSRVRCGGLELVHMRLLREVYNLSLFLDKSTVT